VSTALRDLRDVLERDGNVSVHTTVLQNSNPSAEIIRYCEELGPDLVTIGSQRRRLLERMFLGSTAKAVAATGKWSMLVAPPLRAP
jgi:nucleotide-binding universal stress UspA family protein